MDGISSCSRPHQPSLYARTRMPVRARATQPVVRQVRLSGRVQSLRDTLAANASLSAGLEECIADETADLHFKPGLDHRLPVRTAVGGAPRTRSFPTKSSLYLAAAVVRLPQNHFF
jgi:hypothetical protein